MGFLGGTTILEMKNAKKSIFPKFSFFVKNRHLTQDGHFEKVLSHTNERKSYK